MTVMPLGDRVFVRRLTQEERTKSGLIVPDIAKEKPNQGQVVAVGTGKMLADGKEIPITVKEGDRIIFAEDVGTDMVIEGEEFVIMHEDDILGVMKAGGRAH